MSVITVFMKNLHWGGIMKLTSVLTRTAPQHSHGPLLAGPSKEGLHALCLSIHIPVAEL